MITLVGIFSQAQKLSLDFERQFKRSPLLQTFACVPIAWDEKRNWPASLGSEFIGGDKSLALV